MFSKKISINMIDDHLIFKSIVFSPECIDIYIATYICWETDLNKSSRLLPESQFINSVIDLYVCYCLYTCDEFIK